MMQRVTLSQSSVRPVLDYVLPGLLSGTVGLIVGQGAIGKSMLALQVGLSVATGWPVAGGLWQPGGSGQVVVVCGEDPAKILQERLYWLRQHAGIDDHMAADIDMSLGVHSAVGEDMRIVSRSSGGGYADGPFLPVLRKLAQAQRLIVIDPLRFLTDADENDNGAMTRLVQTLQAVALDTGGAIVVLHHVSKGGEGEREEWAAARGASALTNSVRWQVNLRPPNKSELTDCGISADARGLWVRVATTKVNYGQPPEPAMLYRERGGILAKKTLTSIASARKRKPSSYELAKWGDGDDWT